MTSPRDLQLHHQTALVTGSASGIGRAIALEFARNGADVVVNDRSASSSLDAVAEEIESFGRRALTLPADVSDPASVAEMFERIKEQWGKLDILVNNAGIHCRYRFLEIPFPDWARILAVNLGGYFLCGQAAAKMMAENGGGRIICISSPTWDQIPEGMLAYSVAKAGVNTLFRGMAKELAPFRIRVNAIEPGGTPTGLNTEVDWVIRSKVQPLEARSASGRVCSPEDIAGLALFLVSEAGSHISGTAIRVDGALSYSTWPQDPSQ